MILMSFFAGRGRCALPTCRQLGELVRFPVLVGSDRKPEPLSIIGANRGGGGDQAWKVPRQSQGVEV